MSNSTKTTQKMGDVIYYIAFVILTAYEIFSMMAIKNNSTLYLIVAFCALLPCVRILLIENLSVYKKIGLAIIAMLAFSQYANLNVQTKLLYTVVLVVSAYGLDSKKILSLHFYISLIMTLFMTTMSVIGIIPDHLWQTVSGHTRHSWGALYCTDYAAKWSYLSVVGLYLYSHKLKAWMIALLYLLVPLLYFTTYTRLDSACLFLAITVFLVHKIIQSAKSSNGFTKFWSAFWTKLSPWFMPLAAIFMTVLTLMYNPNNKVLSKINDILSGRLYLGKNAFKTIGLTWFGQEVEWFGMSAAPEELAKYNFVDCSYLKNTFDYGIIVSILIIVAFILLSIKMKKDMKISYVIALIAINAMIAHHLVDMGYCPFLIMLLANNDSLVNKGGTIHE